MLAATNRFVCTSGFGAEWYRFKVRDYESFFWFNVRC